VRIAPRFIYTFAALLLIGASSSAQSNAQAPAITADSVIARYYRAVGGYEKIKAVTTRRMLGTYSEGTMRASTELLWRRPLLRRVNISGTGFSYSEGFDGYSWTFDVATKKLRRDTGAPSDAARRGAEFDEAFVDYRARGHTVTLVGTTRVADFNTYRLRVRLPDGWERDYLIDTSSFLIVAARQPAPASQMGSHMGSYSMYEDWRVVGGVRVPHRFVEKNAETGAVLNTLQWRSITHNAKITDAEILAPVAR
jgi:hypothetical protein